MDFNEMNIPFSSDGPVTASTSRTVLAHEHRYVRPCPVCGLISTNVIHQQNFAGHPRHDIKLCSCGMVYADSGLTQAWYDEYYRERSKYQEYGSESIFDDPRRHEHTATRISLFLHNRQARILDFGCATGNLLRILEQQGYSHLFGFDPSRAAVSKAKDQTIEVINTLACEQFDAIVMSHVVEHVYDTWAMFAEVLPALRENGVLYIEVPDAGRYRCESPYQAFQIEHLNHFSLASLCSLAGRWGLVPVHVGEKTFDIVEGVPYHAIFGVFRKYPKIDLTAYIEQSETKMRAIEERLTEQLKGVTNLVIWGAGQLTMKLLMLPIFREKGRLVRAVDINVAIQGTHAGILVLPPPEIEPSDTILIGSILNAKSIERSIRERGFQNKLIFLS